MELTGEDIEEIVESYLASLDDEAVAGIRGHCGQCPVARAIKASDKVDPRADVSVASNVIFITHIHRILTTDTVNRFVRRVDRLRKNPETKEVPAYRARQVWREVKEEVRAQEEYYRQARETYLAFRRREERLDATV